MRPTWTGWHLLGWIGLTFLAAGCSKSVDMAIPIHVVMSPDGSEFAYSLDLKPYWGSGPSAWDDASFGLVTSSVGIWVYDLAFKKGPRRIAAWSHFRDDTAHLVAWTEDGMYVEYRGSAGRQHVERLDPRTGWRHGIGRRLPDRAVAERLLGGSSPGDSENRNEGRGPVEERFGEFFLWDPVAREQTLLFGLPFEHDGMPVLSADLSRRGRVQEARIDALQDIWSTDIRSTNEGLHFHVATFVRRPAPEGRDYLLRVEFHAPDPSMESEAWFRDTTVTLVDTLVALGPRGSTVDFFVGRERIRRLLHPFRRSERLRGGYSTTLVTELRPVDIPGDEILPPGIRAGTLTRSWNTMVEIPPRALPGGAPR